jgi:hypothetical protein
MPDRTSLPNSRLVTVDECGRIFEADGRRFIMLGLEPSAVLAGLEDLRAGRMRPLADIMEGLRAKDRAADS